VNGLTVVILGGNDMACPAIERIKSHGYKTIVLDGNPQAAAASVSDTFLNVNFSKVADARQALAPFRFDGIVPLNDFAVATAAEISRERGLPGWSAFSEACFTSKVAMKRAWAADRLRTARWAATTIDDIEAGRYPEWDIWPAVAKPSFSGGGSRGVVVVQDWADLAAKVLDARAKYLDGEVLIEEFVHGSEHTLEVLVAKSRTTLLSISDKKNYDGSATVVQNLYFPGPVGNANREELESLVFAACKAMKLDDGCAHFEVLISGGRPYLLEVGGRPGGGLNFHPICELSTGYDYPGLLAAALCGQEPDLRRKEPVHLAWHYFPVGSGVLSGVEGFDELMSEPDVVHAALYEKVGAERLDLRDDLARPGYVLVKGRSHEQARARADVFVQRVEFR
jgi:biotin carboxylase